MDDNSLIFLSYSSPDRDAVLSFHDELAREGYNVWMDKRQLKGGQNWDFEIKRALQKAALIVVFLSHHSVDRRGYAQREIKIALDQAKDRLIDDIYLIPVLLEEDVPIPEQLAQIQAIGRDEPDPYGALKDAIAHQLERLGVEIAKAQAEANIRWTLTTHRDAWEGLPGYETSYQVPHFSSADYPQVGEITDVVRGYLQSRAMWQRSVKFNQSPDLFSFGEDKFRRQNTWEASCNDPFVRERVLSIVYSAWWYSAKAAHPNQEFITFVFTLNPITHLRDLCSVFTDETSSLNWIQTQCRSHLLDAKFDGMANDNTALELEKGWVEEGTKDWSCFGNFGFNNEGLEILFSPYQVAAYAFGPQSVQIPYSSIAPFLTKEWSCLLGIEHLREVREPFPFGVSDPESNSTEDAA